jgi:hypothetical protein
MTEYDNGFLLSEYLGSLKGLSRPVGWVSIGDVKPEAYEPVLLAGPVWKHGVGYFDPTLCAWVVNEKLVECGVFPHWQPLPRPPFYA